MVAFGNHIEKDFALDVNQFLGVAALEVDVLHADQFIVDDGANAIGGSGSRNFAAGTIKEEGGGILSGGQPKVSLQLALQLLQVALMKASPQAYSSITALKARNAYCKHREEMGGDACKKQCDAEMTFAATLPTDCTVIPEAFQMECTHRKDGTITWDRTGASQLVLGAAAAAALATVLF